MIEKGHAYLDKSAIAGNGLFSKTDLEAGTEIFTLDRPLIAVVDTPRLADTCSNCFLWAEGNNIQGNNEKKKSVMACQGCKTLRYCSRRCQAESWKRYHKYECKRLSAVKLPHLLPTAVRATMQLLVMRMHRTISDEAFAEFCSLTTHLDSIREQGGAKWTELQTMAHGAWTFSGAQAAGLPQGVAEEAFARIINNSHTLVTPTFDPLGICTDPFASAANHSCDPNAFLVFDGPRLAVRTLRPIPRGHEILISYSDPTNPFARRQKELKERYWFDCGCSKCAHGPTLPEDTFLIPPSALDPVWAQHADAAIKQHPDLYTDPANATGPLTTTDRAHQRVASLQGLAFLALQDARSAQPSSPDAALAHLNEGMRLCARTGLWAPTRQPSPALRDELFTQLLARGAFAAAWRHAVARHCRVDPVLYPIRWHPVRVVHAWALALLTLYLLTEEQEGEGDDGPAALRARGIDLGLVLYGLLRDLREDVARSHGEGSSFARLVREKADEVAADARADARVREAVERAVEAHWPMFERAAGWVEY